MHNELKQIKKICFKIKNKYNFVIIDDCSSDNTSLFLKKKKILFIKNKTNIGYEKTLLRGLRYGLKRNYKYILTMDGDGEHNTNDIKKLINKCKKNSAELVLGVRDFKPRIMEIVFSHFYKFKYRVSDPLSGFKIYKSNLFKNINISNYNNSYMVDFLKYCILQRKKIFEVNIKVKKRHGPSRIGNKLYVNFKILLVFIKLLF